MTTMEYSLKENRLPGMLSLLRTFNSTASEEEANLIKSYPRRYMDLAVKAYGKMLNSVVNYETVKHFGNERPVSGRCRDSLVELQKLSSAP